MFSFDITTATLVFENDSIKLECIPCEVAQGIKYYSSDYFEDDYDDGKEYDFKSNPTNGEFNFYHDENEIIFKSSGYGNGNGGALVVKIKMTDKICESLKEALEEMKLYAFGG